jgi:wyosine [tRNA(Phe)-imidazoG37] synthetase (radical SAM superfamily)
MVDFRKEFKGKIYLEVFILPGYNNHSEELDELKKAILKINPDLVQLNTLDRPGTLPDLVAATKTELQKIAEIWEMENVEIIAAAPDRKKIKSYRHDFESAILETIARRPCTLADLSQILGKHANEINKYLDVLENENKIKTAKQERGLFYQLNKINIHNEQI